MSSLSTMRVTISTMKTPLSHQILTLVRNQFPSHNQLRYFAKYVPYKPPPKPKIHQNLRAIKTLKSHLRDSYFIAPFPCHGFSANKFKPLKSALSSDPSAAKLVFVKNSLVSKALSGTQFEPLGSCMKGMNSLLFVKKEDAVGPVMGSVKNAVKDSKLEFNDFPGAVVGGQLYGHLDLEVFQNTPSKVEAYGMLLGSLFGPSSTLMAILEGFCVDDSNNVDGSDGVAEGATESKKDVSEDFAQ
ncbi:50S ribosomal protein L10, chloroplastic-like [Amaranthus tricolor]|uniref:50S ribosomal protein L10, chloroplastic-like n=1 Tax=Amaranthus tricolor TaxID=29722 RepID=UPI00258CCC26|nr:50S ribosomal protein L10, chloroplastic-like [Amaranthus tricolor]